MYTQTLPHHPHTIEVAKKVSQFMRNHVSVKEQEFALFSICDIWDYYEVFQGKQLIDFTWEEESKLIIDFCETYRLYLYEKPREFFDRYEAISYAKEHAYKGVILSVLS